MFKSPEQKKEYIAKIAVDVLFAKGFKESSLQNIAAKGKISKAGIYHYFKSKSDILSYILLGYAENGINILHECLEHCKEAKQNPQETFRTISEVYAKNLLKNRKLSLLVLRERHQLNGKHRTELLKREREIFHLLRDLLKQVPNLNERLDENLISFLVISMFHWMGYWFDPKGSLSENEAIHQVMDIVFNGILDKKD